MRFLKKIVVFFVYSSFIACNFAKESILTPSAKFADIVQTKYFVDKTLLMDRIFQDASRYIYIAAPRFFGKSTNLDMLRCFFQLQVTEDGREVTQIETTSNYKLFVQNKLKITRDPDFVENYFGKYPLIWIDFRIDRVIETYGDAINFTLYRIRDLYLQHTYLLNSSALDQYEKIMYQRWIDQLDFFKEFHLVRALAHLSRYLKLYFNKRVIVLIDDFDSLLVSNLFKLKPLDAYNYWDFCSIILDFLVRKGPRYIEKAVIMGVSTILTRQILRQNRFRPQRFLRNDRYEEFFGLTRVEVNDLLLKFNVTDEEREKVHMYYGGYENGFASIYNTWAICNYLDKKIIDNYWSQSGRIWELERALDYQDVRNATEVLLAGNSIEIMYRRLRLKYVSRLEKFLVNHPRMKFLDFWFAMLVDMGYFIQISDDKDAWDRTFTIEIKFANAEVQYEFYISLLNYYDNKRERLRKLYEDTHDETGKFMKKLN